MKIYLPFRRKPPPLRGRTKHLTFSAEYFGFNVGWYSGEDATLRVGFSWYSPATYFNIEIIKFHIGIRFGAV